MAERIAKTERFLRKKLAENPHFKIAPEQGIYRLEHTLRVARIGRDIARAEGMDQEMMTIACLLHDVSYCREFKGRQDWQDHGRAAARIARPFLVELDLPETAIDEICYGIAIHVDDKADFTGKHTAFANTVSDADNIDRFDAYRLYETLEGVGYSKLSREEKGAHVASTLEWLDKCWDQPFATQTAIQLWRDRIGFYRDFYRRLEVQLASSTTLEPQL